MKRKLLALILTMAMLAVVMITVPFAQAAEDDITFLYDDRKELSSLVSATGEVVISDEVVTSYKVGTTQKDDHVLVYQDGTLYAVGTGTAKLTVGETSYTVKVDPAPISLFMITGHSIGAGQEGNGSQSVVVEAGQAYSSYHQNSLDVAEVDGYGLGWGSENRVGGVEGLVRANWDSYGHIDSFAPGMGGNTGAGSGFAYEWNKRTGEKVWVINIAIGGSCVNEWLPGTTGHNTAYDRDYYNQTITKFSYAQTILKNEQAAGHYTLAHQGILNFPGYNFAWYPMWSVETLKQDYETLWEVYTRELGKIDIDGDGENDPIDIMAFTVAWANGANNYDRPVAWYLGTSEEYPQHVIASAGTLSWCDNLSTFPAITYTTQSVAPYVPESKYHTNKGGSSDNSLFCKADTTHYSQVGYNAIGMDMGANLADYFKNGQAEVTSLRLEDYYSKEIPANVTITAGQAYRIVPVVKPVTVSNLTYEVSGPARITYPLAVQGTGTGTAVLTVKQGNTLLKTVTFTVAPAHTHCECGGNLTGNAAAYHECSEALVYEPLTRDCFTNYRYDVYSSSTGKMTDTAESWVLRGGNYYLQSDYSMSNSVCIAPGETVNLCLNGHKFTNSARAFKPNGNLTICDCSEHGTGVVQGGGSTAPVLYSYSGSNVKIYGGTFQSSVTTSREFAGCLAVGNDMGLYDVDINGDGVHNDTDKLTASVSIYGGKFIGSDLICKDGSPTASGSGACIYVVGTKCTLNIYDGEFVGGRTVPVEDGGKGGGGVIGNAGVCNIYGGTFKGSRGTTGAIWTNNSYLTISGSPVFEDNENADIFLHYCNSMAVGQGGLQVDTPIRITGSSNDTTEIKLTDNAEVDCFEGVHGMTMGTPSNKIVKFSRDMSYCICGGTLSDQAKAASGHTCSDASWLSLNQGNITTRFTTASTTPSQTSKDRYYLKSREVWLVLTGDVNLTNEIEISDGYTLHLDLNGYSITHASGSGSLFRVYGNLTICDSYGGGRAVGVRTGTSGAEATCVYVLNYNSYAKVLYKPQFHLYSGTLTGFNITSSTNRTRVFANQAGVVQIGNNSGNKDAAFYMYGGTVRDGYAVTGGNVYLGHGKMYMYDGLIIDGEASGDLNSSSGERIANTAGNLRIGNGNTFYMYGGVIKNGTCAGSGGNVHLGNGTNKLLGGTIENGLSATNGGNIYVVGGSATTIENMVLSSGCAQQGGNVYIAAGTIGLENCQLLDGKAGFTFTRNADGTVAYENKGTTAGNAGNLYVAAGTTTVTATKFTNGDSVGRNGADGFGANIYNKATLTLDSCTFDGGSGFRGGIVGIRDNGSAASSTTLRNCVSINTTATVGGSIIGAWFNSKGGQVIVEGCTFSSTDGAVARGAISMTHASSMTGQMVLSVKNTTINAVNPDYTASNAIYSDTGLVILDGTVELSSDEAAISLYNDSQLQLGDNFQAVSPISLQTEQLGVFATASKDYANQFTSDILSITWNEEDKTLSTNGMVMDDQGQRYATIAQALENSSNQLTLLYNMVDSFTLNGDLWLDLAGYTLTGNISGTGNLYGMDASSDDYKGTDGRIDGQVTCNVVKQFKTTEGAVKRYMAIADDSGYTFHRFYLGITHTTLKPGTTGVGYKAVFWADDAVKAELASFGYTLQLAGGYFPVSVEKTMDAFTSGKTVTLRIDHFDAERFGATDIAASVFVTMTDGTVIESTPISTSMKTILESLNTMAATLQAAQLEALKAMIEANPVMKSWEIDNLA